MPDLSLTDKLETPILLPCLSVINEVRVLIFEKERQPCELSDRIALLTTLYIIARSSTLSFGADFQTVAGDLV